MKIHVCNIIIECCIVMRGICLLKTCLVYLLVTWACYLFPCCSVISFVDKKSILHKILLLNTVQIGYQTNTYTIAMCCKLC